jgi:hypothetical protein
MENPVPVLLHHLGMDIKTGVAKLGDFLGQKFHPLHGITEDYRLINLKL